MKPFVFAIALLAAALAHAADDYPAAASRWSLLTVYSTTDTVVFAPVLRDFQQLNPDVGVRYEELDARELYDRFLREYARGGGQADLLLSSSMDLQVKLVNDGHALPHRSTNASALPNWARWRDEAFGFTFEPAVMVFNAKAMEGRRLPRSRSDLLDLLKKEPDAWKGKVGTYDIVRSSVGYLLASQDARQSNEIGALIEAFADAQVEVEERTSILLDRLARGDLAIGYNLLGSYAQARVDAGAPLVIVQPQDYTLAVSRTAVIPRNGPNPAAAHRFLEYLLSLRGQDVIATRGGLPAIRSEIPTTQGRAGLADAQIGVLRPIALGPGLLVYLDKQKRARLLSSWRAISGVKAPENAAPQ